MKFKRSASSLLLLALAVFALAGDSYGQMTTEDLMKAFEYRHIGPTRMSGRIVDIAAPLQEPYTFYAAGATGGLWKTTNNGTTFEPIFDNESVFSIGDIAVAPSDPNILWVGTGEGNNSRSAYYGDGVYKSTDAGKTWTNMGLPYSQHISRIVIHPRNPNTVYVAAQGPLYSEHEERGLFKTTDGGKTWDKVLFINKRVGVTDVVMDPKNNNTLYAAAYDKYRVPWHFERAGEESRIYKSTNGGKSWNKLSGGLPEGRLGRIGLAIYPKNPNTVFAVIENANEGEGITDGEVYRTDNGGRSWTKINGKQSVGGQPGYYYGQIRVNPEDDQHIVVLSIQVIITKDGGETWSRRNPTNSLHSDHHAWWFDPRDPNHIIEGNDGGLAQSFDGGETWHFFDNLPMGQYYDIGVDMNYPYNVYGGFQDNGTWQGPSTMKNGGGISMDEWKRMGGGDGFYAQVDWSNNRWLYAESQFGNLYRRDLVTGETARIRPSRPQGEESLRYNWDAPILISKHNPSVIYFGTNVVMRSMNRGDNWQEISPDLTLNDPVKIAGEGNIQYCTITTMDESPITPGLLWIGTDDGNVWVSKNGGGNWKNLNLNIPNNPNYWVSRVTASHHDEGTAYMTMTGMRRDDFRPVVYKTTNFGESWTPIHANLPNNEAINVIKEDHKNPNLLFVGTDGAVYVTLTGGTSWTKMRNNMPTAPVHDLVIHPRENDLVVGTHSRGIYITDISPLQEVSADVLSEDVYLFDIEPKVQWKGGSSSRLDGHSHFYGESEPVGVAIKYYLANEASDNVKITVSDLSGKEIRTLSRASKSAGINTVVWNMRGNPPPRREGQRFRRSSPPVAPGEYVVTMEVNGKTLSKRAVILEDKWAEK